MLWWAGVAWATCIGPMPCHVRQVDAACRPSDAPGEAGAPLYLLASCVESMCCAGSAESCRSTYRAYEPQVWRQDGDVRILADVTLVSAGTCASGPRYVLIPPGGTLVIDELVVEVAGALPRTPTPWPPGFPNLDDGSHERVPTADGSTPLVAEGIDALLSAAGWTVNAYRTFATRDGVMVWIGPESITWRSLDLHADGELDGDWFDLGPGSWAIRSYARGVPNGHWSSASSDVTTDGWYVDGEQDGPWLVTTRGPTGRETERIEWCRGVRCGAFERTMGDRVERGAYRDDLRQGPWQTTVNGVVVFEGSYDRDRPVGVHRKSGADGRLYAIESYDAEGRRDGVWLEYDARGQVEQRERYVHGVLRRSRARTRDP